VSGSTSTQRRLDRLAQIVPIPSNVTAAYHQKAHKSCSVNRDIINLQVCQTTWSPDTVVEKQVKLMCYSVIIVRHIIGNC